VAADKQYKTVSKRKALSINYTKIHHTNTHKAKMYSHINCVRICLHRTAPLYLGPLTRVSAFSDLPLPIVLLSFSGCCRWDLECTSWQCRFSIVP